MRIDPISLICLLFFIFCAFMFLKEASCIFYFERSLKKGMNQKKKVQEIIPNKETNKSEKNHSCEDNLDMDDVCKICGREGSDGSC